MGRAGASVGAAGVPLRDPWVLAVIVVVFVLACRGRRDAIRDRQRNSAGPDRPRRMHRHREGRGSRAPLALWGSRPDWWAAGGVHRCRRRHRFRRGRDRGSAAGFRHPAIAVRCGGAGNSLYAGAALLAAWPLRPRRPFTLNVECALAQVGPKPRFAKPIDEIGPLLLRSPPGSTDRLVDDETADCQRYPYSVSGGRERARATRRQRQP